MNNKNNSKRTYKKKTNYKNNDLVKKKKNKKIVKKETTNDKIQSVVSILFTVIIIILLIILVFVLYNRYFKKQDKINVEEVCSDYIKKDYNISEESIINYIKDNRHIIYNIDLYDSNNIEHDIINLFSKYIIWNSDSEYQECLNEEYCLDTKKEMEFNDLTNELLKYFNLDYLNVTFDYNFTDSDTTRLYIKENKVILTFKNMQYETLKHDIIDINIDSNKVNIIFALSKKIDNNYIYIGSKRISLEYNDITNDFNLKNIITKLIN